MGFLDFFRLAFSRASSPDNPLARTLWRWQWRKSQVAMLAAATAFIVAMTWVSKRLVEIEEELPAYLILRLALAVFFWVWMAADHLFSTVNHWKRTQRYDDLRTTLLDPRAIAVGFVGPTLGILLISHTVHCLADAAIPFGQGAGLRSNPNVLSDWKRDWLLYRGGITAALWLNGFATLAAATAWCFRVAVESPPAEVHTRWFATWVRCFSTLMILDLVFWVAGVSLAMWMEGVPMRVSLLVPLSSRAGAASMLAFVFAAWVKIRFVARAQWREAVRAVGEASAPSPPVAS